MNSPFDNIYHKILKYFKSKFATNGNDKLLNKIASGKEVFFENAFEEVRGLLKKIFTDPVESSSELKVKNFPGRD